MNINLHNYEAFVLDYHEGGLSVSTLEELMDFIAKHPELKIDLDADLGPTLDSLEEESFTLDFSNLKKSSFDLPPSLELELAAFLEGDVDELPKFDDQAQLERTLNILKQCKLKPDASLTIDHAPLKFPLEVDMMLRENQLIALVEGDISELELGTVEASELALYQRTVLDPPKLHFANKNELHRTPVVVFSFVKMAQYAAAAIVIGLVALLGFYYNNDNSGQWYRANKSNPRTEKQAFEISVESTQPSETLANVSIYQVVKNNSTQNGNTDGSDKLRVMPLPNRKVNGIAMEKQQAQIMVSSRGSANTLPTELVAEVVNPHESFTPIKTLLETRIKAGLYGSEAYPQDNYVKALMTKASQKAANKINTRKDVDFQVENASKTKRINLRIGKFELNRN